MPHDETIDFYLLMASFVIAAAGYLWLLVAAFMVRFWWGLGILILPPLAFLFIIFQFRKALRPVLVLLLAGVLAAVPYGWRYYDSHYVDLGPREKAVAGELHITLTGWDRNDYAVVLRAKPQTVVLQMANADVTDETLEHLRAMDQLRELDLNDTQVTDQGLAVLNDLPNLEKLRLKNTKITDEGFKEHLEAKESLMELDLRGTTVASKTLREWKAAKEGRKFLR